MAGGKSWKWKLAADVTFDICHRYVELHYVKKFLKWLVNGKLANSKESLRCFLPIGKFFSYIDLSHGKREYSTKYVKGKSPTGNFNLANSTAKQYRKNGKKWQILSTFLPKKSWRVHRELGKFYHSANFCQYSSENFTTKWQMAKKK